MKKKVFITGSNGFIGSHIMNYFLNKGYETIGCDIISSNTSYKVDLTSESETIDFINKETPDIVIHCAGNANVNSSVENPKMDYLSNVVVTQNVLKALKELNNKPRMVFLSSAAVYGNQELLPINEKATLNPLSPYAENKIKCEEMCKQANLEDSVEVKIARIFSVYGSGLKKQIFWDMHNKIVNTGKLEMFGTGNESRDYIHINDLLDVIFLLSTEETEYDVFNVANGEEIYIKDVAKMFAEVNNVKVVYFNGVEMKGNPLNWKADISRIKSLGYNPKISIKDGIKEYSDWVKSINE